MTQDAGMDASPSWQALPDYFSQDASFYLENGDRWDIIRADADGWIPWSGGECPLPDGALHETKSARGDVERLDNPEKDYWDMRHGSARIIAYRPILDTKPGKPEATEWDGGLPPVGCECEVMYCEKWQRCEIIAHFKQRASMVAAFTIDVGDGAKMFDAFVADCFRPVRSEEDRAVEEMVRSVCGGGDYTESLCRALYRAGYRKTAADGEDT